MIGLAAECCLYNTLPKTLGTQKAMELWSAFGAFKGYSIVSAFLCGQKRLSIPGSRSSNPFFCEVLRSSRIPTVNDWLTKCARFQSVGTY